MTPSPEGRQEAAALDAKAWREFDHETIDYVLRYGGRCRECADHHGLCPNGLPCDVDDAKTAIRWVLKALNYGIGHGFLSNFALASHAPLEVKELEWVDCTGANENGEPVLERLDLRAQSGIGNYYVSYDHFTDRAAPIALSTPTSSRTGFATEDQAKAAAQVHFEAAIRSALIPAKPAVEVVEALAELLDEHPGRPLPMGVDAASYGRGIQNGWDAAVSRCIKIVQSLSQAPATPDAQTEEEK